MTSDRSIKLGIRANLGQFSLLVLVNAFVGAIGSAIWVVGALTFGSGLVAALRMTETLNLRRSEPSQAAATCIPVVELSERLKNHEPLIVVDVRSPEEFATGHVPGATNIPLAALEQEAGSIPNDAMVVAVCGKGGGRSERAADLLRKRGFATALALCGGTNAWIESHAKTREAS